MPALATMPQTIADALKAAIDGVHTAEPYAGQFGAGAAGRVSIKAPALLVAIAKAPLEDLGTEQLAADVKFQVYVIAKSKRGRAERHHDATALAESVVLETHGAQWGLTGLGPARVMEIKALYSQALDDKGLALWSVSFEQKVRLDSESIWDGEGVIPTDVFAGVEPLVGDGHAEDYEELTDAS